MQVYMEVTHRLPLVHTRTPTPFRLPSGSGKLTPLPRLTRVLMNSPCSDRTTHTTHGTHQERIVNSSYERMSIVLFFGRRVAHLVVAAISPHEFPLPVKEAVVEGAFVPVTAGKPHYAFPVFVAMHPRAYILITWEWAGQCNRCLAHGTWFTKDTHHSNTT
jgi:hypothetical protein